MINGGSGLDGLFGGGGEDVLNGGASSDQLTGAGGGDTFQFTVTGGIDRITDWQDGIDVLDFTADGLRIGGFTVSTFGGGAGAKIVGGGYAEFFEGVPTTDIDGAVSYRRQCAPFQRRARTTSTPIAPATLLRQRRVHD